MCVCLWLFEVHLSHRKHACQGQELGFSLSLVWQDGAYGSTLKGVLFTALVCVSARATSLAREEPASVRGQVFATTQQSFWNEPGGRVVLDVAQPLGAARRELFNLLPSLLATALCCAPASDAKNMYGDHSFRTGVQRMQELHWAESPDQGCRAGKPFLAEKA